MRYEANMCCGCATDGYPCLGSSCSLRHVPMYKCDICGQDELEYSDIVRIGGLHICLTCNEGESND